MNNKELLQNNIKRIDEATKDIKSFISQLIDDASFVETDVFTSGVSFIDGAEALGEGVVCGYATIGGNPVNLFAQNAEVLKGSISDAHAKKIVKSMERAIKTQTPLISIIDSCGARVGEGVTVLEAYAKILASAVEVQSAVPHICIVKGACVGMMSSFANLADFVFVSNDATMSVVSPMVLASSVNSTPVKYAELIGVRAHASKNNSVNFTYKTAKELSGKLSNLISIISASEESVSDDPNNEAPELENNYTVAAGLNAVCDDGKFIEYSEKFATELKCVLTKINGISAAVIATDITKNEGYLGCDAFIKGADFLNVANSLGLPLITLVDSKGVNATLECELKGFARANAEFFAAMACYDNPMISVIMGKAIGVAYASLASKAIGFDYSYACSNAEISPINGETAVNLVYADELKNAKDPIKEREALTKKYAEIESNPFISAKDGFIDNIISAATIRPYIASALMMLLGI